MQTYDTRPVACPFCSKTCDAVTPTPGSNRGPRDGDVLLCIYCGEWTVFTDERGSGMRKPTDVEYAEIANNPEARKARRAWVKVTEKGKRDGNTGRDRGLSRGPAGRRGRGRPAAGGQRVEGAGQDRLRQGRDVAGDEPDAGGRVRADAGPARHGIGRQGNLAHVAQVRRFAEVVICEVDRHGYTYDEAWDAFSLVLSFLIAEMPEAARREGLADLVRRVEAMVKEGKETGGSGADIMSGKSH